MDKNFITNVLFRCIVLEGKATTVEKRKYWDRHFRKLNRLATMLGWIG